MRKLLLTGPEGVGEVTDAAGQQLRSIEDAVEGRLAEGRATDEGPWLWPLHNTKGPFVVSPFVAIIIKFLVPLLARKLDRLSRKSSTCCDTCTDRIFRIVGLIFAYDGDT